MSYYDFDEHFWSPQEVCSQVPVAEVAKEPKRVTRLVMAVLAIVGGWAAMP